MLNFIIGILVWQIVICIVFYFDKTDEKDRTITVGGIIPLVIFYLVGHAFLFIRKKWIRHHYYAIHIMQGEKMVKIGYRIPKRKIHKYRTCQKNTQHWIKIEFQMFPERYGKVYKDFTKEWLQENCGK